VTPQLERLCVLLARWLCSPNRYPAAEDLNEMMDIVDQVANHDEAVAKEWV